MSTTAAPPDYEISLASAGIRMTPAEFDAVTEYDEEYRYELVHGVLVVTPIPGEVEADPNEELGYLLRKYQENHPQGSAMSLTLPERYIRTHDSRRRADRVVWAGLGRLPDPKVDVPTIAVEFVSSGKRNHQRDYVEKRDEYLALGVVEYWIIDRFQRIMTVYTRGPQGPVDRVIRETETYRTDLLPGFALPLARLQAAADAWETSP